MSIKVLQITAAYKPAYIYGGPTMSVAKLCETLIANKGRETKSRKQKTKSKEQEFFDKAQDGELEIEVFTTTANGQTELKVIPNKTIVVDGVKVTYFKRITKDHTHFSPTLLWALRGEILRNGQNDRSLIVHIHAWWNLVSILSCTIAKWYNIPVILTPRGMLTAYTTTNRNSLAKKIIHRILGENLLKYCHIHVTSEKEKRDVLSIISPKSITVIPNLVELGKEKSFRELRTEFEEITETNNGKRKTSKEQTINEKRKTEFDKSVQSNHLCNQTRSEQQHFKLIFLSRIEEKKGLELLFDALTNVPFSYSLTIAGSGEEKYVERLKIKAEKLEISNRITWLGQVEKGDKFNLLAAHDLMTLTSYNENFANVVIESLSVGTPALLSNEVGLADYVSKKKLGWITDLVPNNITKNLILAFESSELRTKIREEAALIINEDFDSKILIEKYFTLYSQLN